MFVWVSPHCQNVICAKHFYGLDLGSQGFTKLIGAPSNQRILHTCYSTTWRNLAATKKLSDDQEPVLQFILS